ncbi:MAG: hypothetical protein WKF74_02555 [Pyrinomonadaceae bacterium]
MNAQSQQYIERGTLTVSALLTLLVLLEIVGWRFNGFTVYLVPATVSPYVALFAAASRLHRFEPPVPFVFVATSVISIPMLVFSGGVYLIFRPDATAAVSVFWWVPLCSSVVGVMLLSAWVRTIIAHQAVMTTTLQRLLNAQDRSTAVTHGMWLKR